ncbi:SDR family NAD(P)-dependent oxidoreductase [bacterium]|nr:SDR family NAD(P)-dependent oxidoreductase [bacterium]
MVNRNKKMVNEKVCVVTGGTFGFGAVLAERFMRYGYKVAVCSRSSEEKSENSFLSCKADVGKLSDMEKFFQTVINKWSGIDVVIVNAAINIDGILSKLNHSEIEMMVSINLNGFFYTVKPVLPHLTANAKGHIIAVTSYSGSWGTYGQTVYSAVKAGLVGAVKSLAKEVGEYGVCVNAVMPGFMDMGMGARVEKKIKEQAKRNNVLGRLASPDESAGFMVYLSGMKGVSGQVFNLDSRILNWL